MTFEQDFYYYCCYFYFSIHEVLQSNDEASNDDNKQLRMKDEVSLIGTRTIWVTCLQLFILIGQGETLDF